MILAGNRKWHELDTGPDPVGLRRGRVKVSGISLYYAAPIPQDSSGQGDRRHEAPCYGSPGPSKYQYTDGYGDGQISRHNERKCARIESRHRRSSPGRVIDDFLRESLFEMASTVSLTSSPTLNIPETAAFAGCSLCYQAYSPMAKSARDLVSVCELLLNLSQFKNTCIPRFPSFFGEAPVLTLGELIEYNEDHNEKAMPEPVTGQDNLIQAETGTFDQNHVSFPRAKGRDIAQHTLDDAFEQQGVDMIAAPADSSLCVYAAQAGHPLATMPLGQLSHSGRLFCLCMVAKAGREESLLRFMGFYEECTPARPILLL
ncbi:hypothetical protein F5Y18DRAFT_429160 [Xylariaceae sp. FL1019]|nr:hypothetical protein F5Y18DRAFT_429160 [Xylariaceae sp. FL1019]